MQISKAKTQGVDPSSLQKQGSSSYAPLYLSSSLRNIAFDIQELESYALDRLKLLKAIDEARTQSVNEKPGNIAPLIRDAARRAEQTHNLHVPSKSNPDHEQQLLKDEASHFLLRLAMCSTIDHRMWLLKLECDLFAARLVGASTSYILEAIKKANGPRVDSVSAAELEELRQDLEDVARGPCFEKGIHGTKFFKVDFEQVPGLVARRKVLVKKGMAYVPDVKIHDVVVGLFRAKMNQSLTVASKAVLLADKDRRMRPILTSIREHHAADARKNEFDAETAERISLNQLPQSIVAMPLCMMNMMAKLREQHHLRYAARLQLGNFLKGCGLTMEESLRFWQTEFGKGTIDATKFEKTYAYNIRHQYGKEGRRKQMTPYACPKIIVDRPGPGEHNGCPYREFQENDLVAAVRKLGVDPETTKAIAAKAKEGNFQPACGMCFKATQPLLGSPEEDAQEYIPSHPNEYFIEARRRRFKKSTALNTADESDEEMPLPGATESQNESQSQDPSQSQSKPEGKSDGDISVAKQADDASMADKAQPAAVAAGTGETDDASMAEKEAADEQKAKQPSDAGKADDATMAEKDKPESDAVDEHETKRLRTEA